MANPKGSIQADSNQEVWKAIPELPGYEVSDHGRVRSWKEYRSLKTPVPRILISGNRYGGKRFGYAGLTLQKNKKSVLHLIHRLVLEAFVGPCPPGFQACHNDGNRHNNHLSNLRWDTPTSNQHDRQKHGTASIGSKNANSRLTEDQVCLILRDKWTISSISMAKRFLVSKPTILRIWHGRTWKHVTKNP